MHTGWRKEVRHFAIKLQLTRSVLSLSTHKQLDAAFRARNPSTAFDLLRSYKWMQGRTVPRTWSLFEEWADLLDVGRSATWLASSDLDAFIAVLAERYGLEAAELQAQSLGHGPAGAASGNRVTLPPDAEAILGTYACYSHAQSPHYRGHLIRGSLQVEAEEGGLTATYRQAFAGRTAMARGTARLHPNCLLLVLDEVAPDLAPICMSLFRPHLPASLLAGIMQGMVALNPVIQPPCATRFLGFRVAGDVTDLNRSNRYLDQGGSTVRDDLAAHGYAFDAPSDLDRRILECLGDPEWSSSTRLESDAYASLALLVDKAWLSMLDRCRAAAPCA